jgi:hypothetical protein
MELAWSSIFIVFRERGAHASFIIKLNDHKFVKGIN